MQVPVELIVVFAAVLSLAFGVMLQVKQMQVDHLREHVRLYMTNGGRQHVTAEEAASWIATGKLPKPSCQGCTSIADFTLRGAALMAATRTQDYRAL